MSPEHHAPSPIPSIDELELESQRVFVRVDFNVPVRDGQILDDTRIRAALPTIESILSRGGKAVLASHLGRPKGTVAPAFSLEPVAVRLSELLPGGEVILSDDCVGDGPRKLVGDLRDGQVVLLENLRFHPEESANDETFAKELAKFADVYVNDAFGVAHRRHASVDALPRLLRHRGAGHLIHAEVAALGRVRSNPQHPYVAVLGGAKVSDKIRLIEALLESVDILIVGGAMANTFLAAQGHDLQASLVETERLALARSLLHKAEERGKRIMLPVDGRIAERTDSASSVVVPIDQVIPGHMVLDIGPETLAQFSRTLNSAATVFWNGPVGLFENETFNGGTLGIAKAVAESAAYSVVGGGDSVAAVQQMGLADKFDHISTGGGASLVFMQGEKLPGLEALR